MDKECIGFYRKPDEYLTGCSSCSENMPRNECPKSEMPEGCGHHCNHSWEQDYCHWCEKEFGEEQVKNEQQS